MNNFLKELPSKLYTKVYKHIFKDVLENVTFFKNKPPGFISEIMPLMKSVVVHEGYELYSYGSTPRDIFLLLKGRVIVKDKHDAVLYSYVRGSYFGEIEVLFKTDRKSTVQVEQTANLLKIDGQDFLAVLDRFPEIKAEVFDVAHKRFKYFEEMKAKFKTAKKKLDLLQTKTTVNLLKLNPLLEDIMNMKIEEADEGNSKMDEDYEDTEEAFQTIMRQIKVTVQDIKKKTNEAKVFYDKVRQLKMEQDDTMIMIEEAISLIRRRKLKKP